MKKVLRLRKHKRVRKKITGSAKHPRLSVFRSTRHIYAQIIDDEKATTIISSSDLKEKGSKKEKAYKVGVNLASEAKKSKISRVIFDRGGFLYHGRIAELAKGAREGGLKF